MQISQKSFTNRSIFTFDDDTLTFTGSDRSRKASFSVEYYEIPFDGKQLEEKNPWFRTAGFFWLVLGVIHIYYRYMDTSQLKGSIWLTFGLVCLAVYWFCRTRYTVLQTGMGSIFVIRDDKHEAILAEIESRRKRQLRERCGDIDYSNSPEAELRKFELLAKYNVISQTELEEKKDILLAKSQVRQEIDSYRRLF